MQANDLSVGQTVLVPCGECGGDKEAVVKTVPPFDRRTPGGVVTETDKVFVEYPGTTPKSNPLLGNKTRAVGLETVKPL